MIKKILLTFLLSSLYILKSFPDGSDTSRIYGGYYTRERITNLRNNCLKYEWAGKRKEAVIARASLWLKKSDDELWTMVPGQDLPRTIDVTIDRLAEGPLSLGCLVCGDKIRKFGNYPYEPDFENKPWKLTCPSCGTVFPTNDFGKYYRSGIDGRGLFNPAKADRSLLFNTAHPDPEDPLHKFGVDDGFGYIDKNGRAHRFIGYYTWKYWTWLNDGLAALADGFIYTGDKRYAHKAAILLDRIGDVYPDMDWKPYADRGWYHSDGGSMMGKVGGSIWETGVAQQFADSYDKILSGTTDDPELYNFLKGKSKRYRLPGIKGTRKDFIENVDNGILQTSFKAVLSRQIRGNQGMHQLTVAACALALNSEPVTTEWLDWLFKPDGGAIPGLMISRFDRDGTSDEGAPGYALIWGRLINDLARLLEDTSKYNRHNIFRDFPQFKAAYTAAYRMSVLGKATPNLGDSGSTGLVASQANPEFMATGYYFTRDPEIAIAAYRANGNKGTGLGRNIFASNPDAIGNEIQDIGEQAGPRPCGGYVMSGFGLSLLESGDITSGSAIVCDYGRTKMHAHPDLLNFDLFAFGNWLAPDHGYPEFATSIPTNREWTGSTLSHNLVYVNRQPQKEIWGGHTVFFKQLDDFGAFEIDGRKAYPDIKEYRRTMLLVEEDHAGGKSFIVDIFRVEGGNDHVFSFHGPPGTVEVKGIALVPQGKGTYAGEQIPKGIWSKNFPVGYSHLYDVRRNQNPPEKFMLDWQAETGYRGITGKDNIHIRLYALTQAEDVALANGDPPQNKPGNPRKLEYLLIHRAAPDLNSTFVSVLEPYRDKPFIRSVTRLDDSKGQIVAIGIDMTDGTSAYILYNTDEVSEMRLPNGISMTGKLGYVKEKEGRPVKGILVNGSNLKYGRMNIKSGGTLAGKILKMNKELAGGGWLITDAKLPVDGSLNGEQIIIDTESERDASYTIQNVMREGDLTRIDCGSVSFVRDYKGGTMEVRTFTVPRYYDKGYLYDFEEGASFRITSHDVWDQGGN
jgi:hypothetical protein